MYKVNFGEKGLSSFTIEAASAKEAASRSRNQGIVSIRKWHTNGSKAPEMIPPITRDNAEQIYKEVSASGKTE